MTEKLCTPTAKELMKLPKEERRIILAEQANLLRDEYKNQPAEKKG